jgi:hypothetical protein
MEGLRRRRDLAEGESSRPGSKEQELVESKESVDELEPIPCSPGETVGRELEGGSYWLTRILYLRFLGFIYFVAFLISYNQNKELIGDRGLTPARLYLRRVGEEFPSLGDRLVKLPTILWFAGTVSSDGEGGELDSLLDGQAICGLLLAAGVVVRGAANMLVLGALWLLYTSIVNVGQHWFSFGWESQLLETGFLAIWSVPLVSLARLPGSLPPPSLAVWGHRWLIVRIMLGAGLIKVCM